MATIPLVVAPAATAACRAEVFRFRHERGVRPTETLLPGAKMSGGGLLDEMDALAILITAREAAAGRLVGAVRVNLAHEGLGPYAQMYQLRDMEPIEKRMTSVTSGWVTAWDMLGLEVPLALARGLYSVFQREKIVYDYLDCADGERRFFERLGYRPLRRVRNPVRGETQLMRLAVADVDYLQAIGSPLVGDRYSEAAS